MLKRFSFAYKGRFRSPVTAYISSHSAYLDFVRTSMRLFVCLSVFFALAAFTFPGKVQATVNQTIRVQSRLVFLSSGLNPTAGSPACVKAGADTCDFQIRIWNHISNNSTTSGTGNLLFTQTFQDVEIGDNNGIFSLTLNSCGSAQSGNSQWGTSVGTCTAVDDSDTDTDPGVNFSRTDLYMEIGFAPADTSGSLGSFTELFTRLPMSGVPSSFYASDSATFGSSGLTASNLLQMGPSAIQTTGDTTNTLIQINENGTGTPNLIDLQTGGSSKFFVNNTGQTGIGTGTLGNAWLTVSAPTTSFSQFNFASSGAADPSTPNKGDLWYNGTNLNFYNGSATIDLLPTNAQGFVKLQPTSVQTAGGTTTMIWLNSTAGTPNLIDLQVGGTSRFTVNNAGQLQLSRQGSTGGLLLGTDSNLYRSTTTTLKTDVNFETGTNTSNTMSVLGVTDIYGNAAAGKTIANGSTTANGAGSNSNVLVVASTTNFDVGNLVLINGATYATIESVDSPTQMTISPAATWSNGNTVVEYTAANIGGDGTLTQQRFAKGYFVNGITTGGSGSGTRYGNGTITTAGGINFTTQTASGSLELNAESSINLSTTDGLYINKNDKNNVAGSWSSTAKSGPGISTGSGVVYNGKFYAYGGFRTATSNELSIYDFASNTWSTATPSSTARYGHTAWLYNDKMYVWGGCSNDACSTETNTLEIYDFKTDTWSSGTTGGTARAFFGSGIVNSKIYIWGGCITGCTNANTTLDIYDIVGNSWSTGASGGTRRSGLTSTVYNNKVYFWGGVWDTNLNTMDIYDPKTNTWSTGVAGGSTRDTLTSQVYNGKWYLWGGRIAGVDSNTMDIYDFATQKWTTGVTGGSVKRGYIALLYNGKIYNYGGTPNGFAAFDIFDPGVNTNVLSFSISGQDSLKLDTSNTLTSYNVPLGLRYVTSDSAQYTTQGYTTGTAGGTGRFHVKAVEYNGKAYIWGGCTTTTCSALTNTLDIYDLTTNTWTTGATGGTSKYGYVAEVYNGKIYYIGGCTNLATTCATASGVVDIYDIAGNSWTTGTAMTAKGMANSVTYAGKIYVWGGFSGAANVNTMLIYDIVGNSWSTGTAGGTARRGGAAALYNGKMYNWAGFTTAVVNTLDIYDIKTDTWSTGTAGGTARDFQTVFVYNGRMYGWAGFTTVAVNTRDVYDFATNTWITGNGNGGSARYGYGGLMYRNKIYGFTGFNGTSLLTSIDIYDFGVSNYDDIFYIANAATSGPGNGKLFRFDTSGRAYTSKQGGWFSTGADYAEYMYTQDTSLVPGELVSLDDAEKGSIKRSIKARDPKVVGAISTQPGFVGNISSVNDLWNSNSNWKLMSMVGQVPVKVNDENGKIKVGDSITSSSTAGVGMKANKGDPTIGIAEENYDGHAGEVKTIRVLITRNNQGLNGTVELKFGDNNEAGFRVNEQGKLEYREASSNTWRPLTDKMTVDSSLAWQVVGDNAYSTNSGPTVLGIDENTAANSNLVVSKDIEARSGPNFIKITSDGQIAIGGYSIPLGFRVNPQTKELEYQDAISKEWLSISSFLSATSRVDVDKVISQNGQKQISGWGYVRGEANGKITFPTKFGNIPIVGLSAAGSSDKAPTSLAQCSNQTKFKAVAYQLTDSDIYVQIKLLEQPKSAGEYYCYTWLATGV